MPRLDPALMEVLVCPQCHGTLQEDAANSKLRCEKCGLAFPVEDGIPIMLVEEAEKITPADK